MPEAVVQAAQKAVRAVAPNSAMREGSRTASITMVGTGCGRHIEEWQATDQSPRSHQHQKVGTRIGKLPLLARINTTGKSSHVAEVKNLQEPTLTLKTVVQLVRKAP